MSVKWHFYRREGWRAQKVKRGAWFWRAPVVEGRLRGDGHPPGSSYLPFMVQWCLLLNFVAIEFSWTAHYDGWCSGRGIVSHSLSHTLYQLRTLTNLENNDLRIYMAEDNRSGAYLGSKLKADNSSEETFSKRNAVDGLDSSFPARSQSLNVSVNAHSGQHPSLSLQQARARSSKVILCQQDCSSRETF